MKSSSNLFREITPLLSEDCFFIINRTKERFTYPLHVHEEFELNFVENAKGALRVVGDSTEEISDLDLCLIGNENMEHAWMNGNCESKDIKEITIQFQKEYFLQSLLNKKQFHSIAKMFQNAQRGIAFSRPAIESVKDRIKNLCYQANGFYSVIEFLNILYDLSNDRSARVLSSNFYGGGEDSSESRRVKKVMAFLQEKYNEEISLKDVADIANMTEVAFSRFMKKRTGKTYIEYLTDLRLSVAMRLLLDTNKTVSEICYECGFNNLSNFNRMFKKKKGTTPSEYRENYLKTRILV